MRLPISCRLLLLSLTCHATATPPVSVLRHADHRHTATNTTTSTTTISAALFAELEELARIVDIAYCVGSSSWGISKPFSCLSRCSDFPHFALVTSWNTGPLLSDSCGYIALDHAKQRVIVAFRGTYSIANTIVDLSTVPQKYVPYPGGDDGEKASLSSQPKCTNCTVHMGFHSSWLNTRKQILPDLQAQLLAHPTYQLTLVGHSLGGAVAALAALDLLARGFHPTITTFGEPRTGNNALAAYMDSRFHLIPTNSSPAANDTKSTYRRLTHIDDPVPLLPLTEWGYAPHAGEIFISKPALSPDLADLLHCDGDADPHCIAGQDATLLASVQHELHDLTTEPAWGIPSRYKLWQLFFAHRDYFWRLGLCLPGGDPLGGGRKYASTYHDDL